MSLLIHVDQRDWIAAAGDAAAIGRLADLPIRTAGDARGMVMDFVRGAATQSTHEQGATRRPVWTATLYAVAGDSDEALFWLERAVIEQDPDLAFDLRNPAFDAVRQLPRFRAVAAATGLGRAGEPAI